MPILGFACAFEEAQHLLFSPIARAAHAAGYETAMAATLREQPAHEGILSTCGAWDGMAWIERVVLGRQDEQRA